MKQNFNPEISEAHKRAQWEEQDTVDSHHPVAPPVTKRGALAAVPGKELKRQTAKGGGVRNVFRPRDTDGGKSWKAKVTQLVLRSMVGRGEGNSSAYPQGLLAEIGLRT